MKLATCIAALLVAVMASSLALPSQTPEDTDIEFAQADSAYSPIDRSMKGIKHGSPEWNKKAQKIQREDYEYAHLSGSRVENREKGKLQKERSGKISAIRKDAGKDAGHTAEGSAKSEKKKEGWYEKRRKAREEKVRQEELMIRQIERQEKSRARQAVYDEQQVKSRVKMEVQTKEYVKKSSAETRIKNSKAKAEVDQKEAVHKELAKTPAGRESLAKKKARADEERDAKFRSTKAGYDDMKERQRKEGAAREVRQEKSAKRRLVESELFEKKRKTKGTPEEKHVKWSASEKGNKARRAEQKSKEQEKLRNTRGTEQEKFVKLDAKWDAGRPERQAKADAKEAKVRACCRLPKWDDGRADCISAALGGKGGRYSGGECDLLAKADAEKAKADAEKAKADAAKKSEMAAKVQELTEVASLEFTGLHLTEGQAEQALQKADGDMRSAFHCLDIVSQHKKKLGECLFTKADAEKAKADAEKAKADAEKKSARLTKAKELANRAKDMGIGLTEGQAEQALQKAGGSFHAALRCLSTKSKGDCLLK